MNNKPTVKLLREKSKQKTVYEVNYLSLNITDFHHGTKTIQWRKDSFVTNGT